MFEEYIFQMQIFYFQILSVYVYTILLPNSPNANAHKKAT